MLFVVNSPYLGPPEAECPGGLRKKSLSERSWMARPHCARLALFHRVWGSVKRLCHSLGFSIDLEEALRGWSCTGPSVQWWARLGVPCEATWLPLLVK